MNRQQNRPYILFYSEQCTTSTNLRNLMFNAGILGNFKQFSVERDMNLFPKEIQKVPTIIVPEANRPLVAQEAFKWLESIKFIRHQQIVNENKKIIQANMLKSMAEQQGPGAMITSEMSGFSDGYAYTSIDNAQAKSFFGYGEEAQNAICTYNELGKLTKEEQNKKISIAENDRKKQDAIHKDKMKNEQLDAVMKAEQSKLNSSKINKPTRR